MSQSVLNQSKKKFEGNQATVAVAGLGYVGLPLALLFAESGLKTIGVDKSKKRVSDLIKGKSYIDDIPSKDVKRVVQSGRTQFSTSEKSYGKADAIIICVPTPLNKHNDPDLSYVISVAEDIANYLKKGQLVILESTTYPGTTDEVILPILEKSGLKAGKDFFLCFSPERIDPGNKKYKPQDIPKVVGGYTSKCSNLAKTLYKKIICEVVPVSSTRTAEMTKLLENTFRIVNIGLVNELAIHAKKLKVNIWEAVDAAKTKPFGFMPFYPGPGIGGHCIGIDPLYLSWKAKVHGSELKFIDLAGEMNADMPYHVVREVVYLLNLRSKKPVKQAKVLLLGVAYKKDISDTRESPALDIIEDLAKVVGQVHYHDPFVKSLTLDGRNMKSQVVTTQNLKKYDCIVVTTDHSNVDYDKVVKAGKIIYDTRNILKNHKSKNIVRM